MNRNSQTESYSNDFEVLRSENRIISSLGLLQNPSSKIQLAIPKHNTTMYASLLYLDLQADIIHLSTDLNTLLLKHIEFLESVSVYAISNGSELFFESIPYSFQKSDHYINWGLRFPELIRYRQRRSHHRVHLSMDANISVKLTDRNGNTHLGVLRDISADGMRINFAESNPGVFLQNEIMGVCSLHLPKISAIKCNFQVKHRIAHKQKIGCTVGGCFINIATAYQRNIEKFMAGMERRQVRGLQKT